LVSRDGDDLAYEAEDVFGVVFAIGVVGDAGAGGGSDAVLVDNPLEGGAVTEAVVVDVERDAAEGEEVVVLELGAVLFVEDHAGDAEGDFGLFVFICSSLCSGSFS
jgi:hypothetical protein